MGVFAERVTRRFSIDRSEVAFLERLEENPFPVRRGDSIAQEYDLAENAFVLMTGWVMSCSRFPDDCIFLATCLRCPAFRCATMPKIWKRCPTQ